MTPEDEADCRRIVHDYASSLNQWGKDGSFFGVAPEGIAAVVERNRTTVEVTTQWSYMLPGGRTLFVLKGAGGRWLIDGLKTQGLDGEWENALL